MKIRSTHQFRSGIACVVFTSGLVMAQDLPPAPQNPAPAPGGWRRVGDQPPAGQSPAQSSTPAAPTQPDQAEPVDRSDSYGQPASPQTPQGTPSSSARNPQAASRPAYGLPAQLTVKPGTFVTVRTNTVLSSNHNHEGDIFTATLAAPLVVDGIVVAQRGQTVVGRVAEAKKVDGVHRLGLELSSVTLADGSQAPMQSKLFTATGPTTPTGQQVGTVAATTAVGAGVGAAAAWGTGAAVGGGIGAIAGIAGVLATRNHPTVLYPETALTFQITSPVTVSTTNAPQAFRYAGPEDFQQPRQQLQRAGARPPACGPYGCPAGPGYFYGGPAYPGYYAPYPYYWGPGVGIAIGGGWGGWGWGRRWR